MTPQPENRADDMSFGEHIDALRPHLMRGAGAILLLAIAAFCCKEFLVDRVLFGPLRPDFPTNRLLAWLGELSGVDGLSVRSGDFQLINTSVALEYFLKKKQGVIHAFLQ